MGIELAVFVENKPGKLEAITRLLADEGINIRGVAMASGGQFGVLKLLVSDPARAHAALRRGHFTVSERKVEVVLIDDRPGALHELLLMLASAGINIEDCYGIAFEGGHQAAIVLDVDRFPETEKVLKARGLRLLSDREIYAL
jgi:hypothetical protein